MSRPPAVWTVSGSIELAFRSYPLMRLIGAFDAILKVAALGRQKARYRIDAVRHTRTNVRCVVHYLPDFEFMGAHSVLDYSIGPRAASFTANCVNQSMECCRSCAIRSHIPEYRRKHGTSLPIAGTLRSLRSGKAG